MGRHLRLGDERGSALVLVMLIITSLAAMAAALFTVAHANRRATDSSMAHIRALYNAETGASLSVFEIVTDTDLDGGDNIGTIPIGGGNINVGGTTTIGGEGSPIGTTSHAWTNELGRAGYVTNMVNVDARTVLLTSTGFDGDSTRQVEIYMVKPEFNIDGFGAVSMMMNPNANLDLDGQAGIPVSFNGGNAYIRGDDHDPAGNLLNDQSNAMPTLTLNQLTGGIDWAISEGGNVGGGGGGNGGGGNGGGNGGGGNGGGGNGGGNAGGNIIEEAGTQVIGPATTNNADYQGDFLNAVIAATRQSADITLNTADGADNGNGGRELNLSTNIGSPTDYKTVYVKGSDAGKLKMAGQFQGYGILVIEANGAEQAAIHLSGQAQWRGLIIVVDRGDYTADKADPITLTGGGQPENSPHIVGGIVSYLAGDTAELENGSSAIRAAGNATLKFSSEAIQTAISSLGSATYDVRSYRIVN